MSRRPRSRQIPTLPPHGHAFRGTRSLDLIVIVRVFICLILIAVFTGVMYGILFRMGILEDAHHVPVATLVATIILSALVTQLVLSVMLHRLLKPIRELREAMERVTQGDFSVRVDDEGADNELGSLLRSFNTMASELGSIETLRDEFVDDFSHELKTPVTSIRGFARQIERDEAAAPETHEYAAIIESEANRLLSMSSNALLLNRFETQQVVADPRLFSLDEQLRRCVLMLQEQWESRGIEMSLELEATSARGSEEMLAQVWLNVLDNAIKYSPDGACVRVRCWQRGAGAGGGAGGVEALARAGERADDRAGDRAAGARESALPARAGELAEAGPRMACVSVRDEGPGMDAATLAHAFNKFYRGSETAASTSGNGLGLPIVKRIVELSGGRIEVRTEPGRGTEFRVELPA